MKWETDAEKAVEKVPFFVRRMAKKRVEDYVRQRGRDKVTTSDVHDARNVLERGSVPEFARVETTEEGGLTESRIRRIEQLVERSGGHEARFYSIKACGGAVGCPLTKFDVQKMADRFKQIIDDSGLAQALESRVHGPVLSHHKFKVALAGCPNNCSEPQIKDFAVTGVSTPGLGPGDCIECGQCEAACQEDAVKVDGQPHISRQLCVGCGDCAAVCPTQSLKVEKEGVTVLVGGKLGRHPQLATRLIEVADEEQVHRALEACIDLLKEEGRGGERLGAVLNRVGIEKLESRCADEGVAEHTKA
ncbi:MAG: 4Fe-4S dicluster domain-containing protein [Chloroflexi bacterium]|nr:4Fe-4S dicluster domain-containing protein [Chloroflexota bacterium]